MCIWIAPKIVFTDSLKFYTILQIKTLSNLEMTSSEIVFTYHAAETHRLTKNLEFFVLFQLAIGLNAPSIPTTYSAISDETFTNIYVINMQRWKSLWRFSRRARNVRRVVWARQYTRVIYLQETSQNFCCQAPTLLLCPRRLRCV